MILSCRAEHGKEIEAIIPKFIWLFES